NQTCLELSEIQRCSIVLDNGGGLHPARLTETAGPWHMGPSDGSPGSSTISIQSHGSCLHRPLTSLAGSKQQPDFRLIESLNFFERETAGEDPSLSFQLE
ncbi:hypothetical protein RUM43_011420, partial [Polyplax serrata]